MNATPADLESSRIASQGIRIPPQPAVILELAETLASDNYDAHKIATIIGRDPGLSAAIFKTVRSPLFGCSVPPASLEQAIMRIGFRQTMNIARALALESTFQVSSRRALELFWVRSRELADLASQIAHDRVSVCNIFPDQAYLAGMFFECGIPVLMQRYDDYCRSLLLEERLDLPSLREEDARFNADHCAVGYLVARHWHLPDFVSRAVFYRDTIPSEEESNTRSLCAILQLAFHVRTLSVGLHNPSWAKFAEDIATELGFHAEELDEFLADLLDDNPAAPV